MRFLMKMELPTAEENPAVADPGFNEQMKLLMRQIKAERASFAMIDGRRVEHIIVNVPDALDLPALAEPFYNWLGVKVEFLPQMTPEEAAAVKPRFDAVKQAGKPKAG